MTDLDRSGSRADSDSGTIPREPASASGPGAISRGRRWRCLAPVLLVLLFGVGLRSAQYFGHVDMWYDELAVARNIEDRDVGDLLRPLDHRQVAPFGFLATVDVASEVFGVTEAGLRFVPWLFGLASVFLFWRVATRFAAGSALLAPLALFAFSPAFVWYSSSVKPYGSDITISLLLAWLSLRYLERPDDRRRGLVAGVVGAVMLLFSFPAVPTAAILAAILALGWRRRRPRPSPMPLMSMVGIWAVGMAVAGFVASGLVDEGVDSWMREIHAERFPPADPLGAVAWSVERVFGVYAHGLVYFPPSNPVLVAIVTIPLVFAVLGVAFLARRDRLRALILLTPPLAGVSAAAVHLLPFFDRLGLHASWPFLMLAGAGLELLRRRTEGRRRWLAHAAAAVMALPLVAIVLLTARPPFEPPIPARNVVEKLATEIQPGDPIYVYTQGRHAMAFYGGRAGIEEWIQGERHPDDPRGYLREVDALRGEARAWYVWVDLSGDGTPDWIRSYLDEIGTEVDRIPEDGFRRTGAVLYDLSDPERLEAASAESFPLPSRDVE